MRTINTIIIHCSDTPADMDIGARDIRLWHVRDNGWRDIGYHGVIRRNGLLESGRPLNQAGAHTAGHNKDSVGICLVGGRGKDGRGENNFTRAQFETLAYIVRELLAKYPKATLHGHRDFAAKECPCFDVAAWWESVRGKQPAAGGKEAA